jgi:hypothetical protein
MYHSEKSHSSIVTNYAAIWYAYQPIKINNGL